MPAYVLDTSVVIQWFHRLNERHVAKAKKVWEDLQSGKITVILPDFLLIELLNAFIKGKYSSIGASNLALAALYEMPINIVEITLPVLQITAALMKQYDLTAYDACFLALAEQEGCQLVSDDQKAHGRITNGRVIMLEDYLPEDA
ncbi:type II toxin-antitoxin system VapC family toxin [Candidatus Daviesbacteria bacterium]|nr:type II toxin-antitoxin system VapC family toxin [Candidatus Daviesbacteria bacterium]